LGLPDWGIIAFFSSWIFYYVMIHGLYYGLGGPIKWALKTTWPNLPTNKISDANIREQIKISEIAFPLYCLVPTIGDLARRYGLTRVCDDFASCGGVVMSTFNFVVYMFLVEGGVFFVHYWMLHKWVWGKKKSQTCYSSCLQGI